MSARWAKRLRTIDGLPFARDEGFGGCVLPVGAVMEWDDEEAFSREKARLRGLGISFEVFDSPLPKGVRVTEPGFNIYSWTEYLKTALRRVADLGGKTLVWADGRARVLPFEGDVATPKENFNQFVFMLCEIAERLGIAVCIEPLGGRRTNYLNSPEELSDFFRIIGKSNLGIAVSPRDLVEMGLGWQEVATYRDSILHVHLENPRIADASTAPRSADGYDYGPFLAALKGAGYSGTFSLPHDADAAALTYAMGCWKDAAIG